MDRVAALPARDRSDLFRETAAQMGFHPAIVAKDFWVCWTLKQLFSHPIHGTHPGRQSEYWVNALVGREG